MKCMVTLVAAIMAWGLVALTPTQSDAGWRRGGWGPGVSVRVGPRWGGPRVYAGPRRVWQGPRVYSPRVYVGPRWRHRHWRRW